MRAFITVLALAAACAAHPAAAQTFDRTLPDGRTVALPAALSGCERTRENDQSNSVLLRFTCTIPDSGWVQAVAIAVPMDQTPRAALEGQARKWWSDFASWPADQQANVLSRQTKTFAGGIKADFLCLHRDNIDALNGDAACILETAAMQLIIEAQSGMAATADDLIDSLLAATTLR